VFAAEGGARLHHPKRHQHAGQQHRRAGLGPAAVPQ
jgi:hypothetical protein